MRKTVSFFLLIAALAVGSFSCSKTERESDSKPKKKQILVSIPPYAFLAKRIGGTSFEVQTIVSESSNPHVFEPKPKDVADVQSANIWFKIGEPFEEKIERALPSDTHVVNINEKLALLPASAHCKHSHHKDAKDLHTWLSPHLFSVQAQEMAKTLMTQYPEYTKEISKNLDQLYSDLNVVERQIATQLRKYEGSTIMVSHPALAYYCHDYGLKQLSVECEGKEPTIKQVQNVISTARAASVKNVLLMPQYSNKGALLIAEELNLATETINPYSEEYINNIKQITQAIIKGSQ